MQKRLFQLVLLFTILSAIWTAMAPEKAMALSVEVKNLSYFDPTVREIQYDFSSGTIAGNTITLPETAVITRPVGDTGSYTWGPYPDPQNAIIVGLDTVNRKATLQTDTQGGVIINTTIPSTATAVNEWVYSVTFQNFAVAQGVDSQFQIGFGSLDPAPHPELTALWRADGKLELMGQIYDDSGDGTVVWQSASVVLDGLTPSSTTLDLRVGIEPSTNFNLLFEYRLDSAEAWVLIGTYDFSVEEPLALNGFPQFFPYVSLMTEEGTPPQTAIQARVFSQHLSNDGEAVGYYAGFSVHDENHELLFISVTGAGIATAYTNFVYDPNSREWIGQSGVFLSPGPEPPPDLPTYTFSLHRSGDIITQDDTITGYVKDFVTDILPEGNVTGNVTFSWTGITGATNYGVELRTLDNQRVWNAYNLPPSTNSLPYGGPPLSPGQTYFYFIQSTIDPDAFSFARGQFTYEAVIPTGISFTGVVENQGGGPISEATIELVGSSPLHYTLSDAGGHFTLGGLSSGETFHLKISKPTFSPGYSADFHSTSNIIAAEDYTLFPPLVLALWGVTPGKGVIQGRVGDQAGNFLTGAFVTVVSSTKGRSYIVKYGDDAGSWRTTDGTYSNGRYYIMDVEEGDVVTVTASKTDWSFNQRTFHTHADSVSQGQIMGTGLFQTAQVSGALAYSGEQGGDFKLRLWSADMMSGELGLDFYTPTAGAFTFHNVPNGRYYISAFRDSNQDGMVSAGEAYGYHQDANGLIRVTVQGSPVNMGTLTLSDPAGTPTGASVTLTSVISGLKGYLIFFKHGDTFSTSFSGWPEPIFSKDVDLVSGTQTYTITVMDKGFEGMPVPAGAYDFYFMTGDLTQWPEKGIIQYFQANVVITPGSMTPVPSSGAIPFTEGGIVSGQVASSVTGNPLPLVMVFLSADPEGTMIMAWGKTDQTGHFLFNHLPVGTYYLDLVSSGYNDFTPLSFTVTQGETTSIDINATKITPAQTPGAIAGILSPIGSGVESRVLLMQGGITLLSTSPSLADGAYTITDVVPGTYTLLGSARGHVPQQAAVTVGAGQTLTRNITIGSTKDVIVNGVAWLLSHQRTDGSLDDNLTGDPHQYVFGWTGYAGLALLSIYENPQYSQSDSPDFLGTALLDQIRDALYGTEIKNGIKQYFEATYHSADDPGTPWDDRGAFYDSSVSFTSVAATPVALEKLIALGLPLSDPRVVGAVNYLLNAQITAEKARDALFAGGWRYHPQNDDADNWETSWVIMSLMKAGVNPTVPQVLAGLDFIKKSQILAGEGTGLFKYMPDDAGDWGPLGTSAACILALNFAGETRNEIHVNRFFQWARNNPGFEGLDRYADAYWWSMFPWAAILYADPDHPGKTEYDTLMLTWNMADRINLLQKPDGSWENPSFVAGGSRSGNSVMHTASAIMAIAPYAGLTPRPEEVKVSGLVRDHNAQLLVGARVEGLLNSAVRSQDITKGDGGFELSLPKDYTYDIRIIAMGYAPKTMGNVLVGSTDLVLGDISFDVTDVDDVPPAISNPHPAHGDITEITKPLISATLSDAGAGAYTPAGIDPSTIIMKLDGNSIPAVYSPAEGSVSFLPMEDLNAGLHAITVDVKDFAGNAALQFIWQFTVRPALITQFARTQVTSGPGLDDYPSWMPSGERIAFASDRAGTWDIWTVRIDGTDLQQLTSGPTSEKYPSWSPKGDRIAYIVEDEDIEPWGGFYLYSMKADGSEQTVLPLPQGNPESTNIYWEYEMKFTAWTDDRTVAFVSFGPNGGPYKIYAYDVMTGLAEEITPPGEANPFGDIYKISWSAVKNLMAYDRFPMGIQTFAADGSSYQMVPIPVSNQTETPTMPEWSPDGGKMAYVRNLYSPDSDICIFDLITGARVIDETANKDTWPAWSPDGSRIAIASDGDIYLLTLHLPVQGDLNADGKLDLSDAVLALRISARIDPQGLRIGYMASRVDINGDNKVGLEEVMFILQTIADMRN